MRGFNEPPDSWSAYDFSRLLVIRIPVKTVFNQLIFSMFLDHGWHFMQQGIYIIQLYKTVLKNKDGLVFHTNEYTFILLYCLSHCVFLPSKEPLQV